MNFEEYQKLAITTAICKRKIYFLIGLLGEVGELANQTKKILRDDDDTLTSSRRLSIKGEIGGVLWYIANLCEEFDIQMADLHSESSQKGYAHHGMRDRFHILIQMNQETAVVAQIVENYLKNPTDSTPPRLQRSLTNLFFLIEEFCTTCCLDIKMVADYNIEKLFSRRKRGVIQGDGDER